MMIRNSLMVGVVFKAVADIFYLHNQGENLPLSLKKEEIKIISPSPYSYKFHNFFVSCKAHP